MSGGFMKKIFAIAAFIIFFNSCGGGTIGDAQNFEPNEPPAIVDFTVVSVDGSPTDALKAGMKYTITVKAKDPENKKLKFQFNSDYGYFGNPVNTDDSCSISFVTGSFVRPGLPVTVDVSVIDHRDASAVTNYEIGKGRRGPTVTIKYIGSAYIQKEKNTQISFKANCEGIYQLYCDNGVDESSADLRPALAYFLYRKDENGNFKDIIVDIKGPASTADAKVQLSTLESVNKVWVVFSDGINDPFAALAPVTVDNTPPLIESIDTGGSEGVGLRSPVRLVFNEEIMPSSVSDNSVEVEDGGSFFSVFNASGRCSVEGKIITFVPDGLEYYSKYKVSGRSGIKDLAGNEYVYTDSDSNTFTTVEKGTTPNPVFSLIHNGVYDSEQSLAISQDGAQIFCTSAVGSPPAEPTKLNQYNSPIPIPVNTNIKAYAWKKGYKPSSTQEITVKIRTPKPEFQLSTCLPYPVQSFAESKLVYPTGGVNYATIDIANAYPSGTEIKYNQSDSVGNWYNALSTPDDPKTASSSNWVQMTKNPGAYRYAVYAKSPNMEPSETVYSTIYRVRGLSLPSALLTVNVSDYMYLGNKEWKAVSCSSSGQYVAAIEGSPDGNLWVSDDYGVTWMKSSAGEKNWNSCYVSKTDPSLSDQGNDGKYMTATRNENVCRSVNYGENWTFPDGGASIRNGVYFDKTKYWIAYGVSNKIYGNNSKQISDSALEAFSADGSIVFYLDSSDSLLKYWQNDGLNTIDFASSDPINSWKDLAISGNGTRTAAIAYNGSTNFLCKGNLASIAPIVEAGGGNFSDITISYDGNFIAACVMDGKVYRNKTAGSFTGSGTWYTDLSFDGGNKSWSGVAINGTGNEIFAAMNGGDIWCANYNGSVWNWSSQNTRTWTGVACSSDGKFIAACDGGAGAHGGYIYTSSNGGANWNLVKKDSDGNSMQKKWKSIDMSNDGLFIAAVSEDEYYFSENHGLTWTKKTLGQASDIKLVKVSVSGTSDSVNAKAVIITNSPNCIIYIRNRKGDPCIGNGSNAWNGAYVFNDVKVSNDGMSFLLLSENKIVKIIYSQDNSVLNGSDIDLNNFNYGTNFWVKFAASDDLSKIYIARYNSAKSGYLIDLFYNFSNSGTVNESNPINAGHFGQMKSSADGNMLVAVNSHVNTDSFIYTSINGGQNWEKQTNSGSVIYNCIASTADGLTIFAGGTKQTGIMMLK